MERSLLDALTRLGTSEVFNTDSEVRDKISSLFTNIKEASEEGKELLYAVITEGEEVIDEVKEARDDLVWIAQYLIEFGIKLGQELQARNFEPVSARGVDFDDPQAGIVLNTIKRAERVRTY